MIATIRSELVRLRRPRLLIGWAGLMALFAVLVNTVMFGTVGNGTELPPGAPGVSFPTATELAGPDGLVAGLAAAASMFGVVTLSFWAIATATDYSSGLIRLLVAAQPHRWRLLAGKVLALAGVTAITTTIALIVNVAVAMPAAGAAGISTAAWGTDLVTTVAGAWINAYAAMLAWGVIGLVLAVVTRSAAVAISIGVGYVLVPESIVKMGLGDGTDWLLGSTLSALAAGGTTTLSHAAALTVAVGYVIIGLGAAGVLVTRRDVTD
jgi:ABC-type transport system involved in multi-copper enzyme maturation permease subunit